MRTGRRDDRRLHALHTLRGDTVIEPTDADHAAIDAALGDALIDSKIRRRLAQAIADARARGYLHAIADASRVCARSPLCLGDPR